MSGLIKEVEVLLVSGWGFTNGGALGGYGFSQLESIYSCSSYSIGF